MRGGDEDGQGGAKILPHLRRITFAGQEKPAQG